MLPVKKQNKELTTQQKTFIDFLFGEAQGNPKKAADLKHKVDYIVIFPDGAFSYTEEAGVFSVTEIFEVFIEGIED